MKNSLKIIAVRASKIPAEITGEARRKAGLIQKRAGETTSWHYFYENYVDICIYGDDVVDGYISYYRRPKSYQRLYDLDNINVDVCAIVGKNGAGKSSLIDLLLRTINNLSAALIGEGYVYAAAEHLHFIENVYSDVCYERDGIFYVIEMRGREVRLHSYRRTQGNLFLHDEETQILARTSDVMRPLSPDKKWILQDFLFYTIVCNYSMYGFNYRDYIEEKTPEERLHKIYNSLSKEEFEERGIKYSEYLEDSIWLKGLFYKNDGYQTPIVIHPMRVNGEINVNSEIELSKERLMKIFFYQNKNGEYPLRTINGNLVVNAVRLTLRKEYESVGTESIIKKLKLTPKQNLYKNIETVGDIIFKFWINEDVMQGNFRRLTYQESQAIQNYIVYKTIKIIYTYPQFRKLKSLLRSSNIDNSIIKNALKDLCNDNSAKTRKLRRAINFLTTDIYDSSDIYPIDYLTNRIKNIAGMADVDPYLPPPIYDIDFILSKGDCNDIAFCHLSSGEKQIAYTIGGFLYHISNVDSAWKAKRGDVLKYRYINVIFDEVEQYYHPELQRCFLSYLLKGLSCMDFTGLKGINIMMATHSPFILSDIPRNNVLIMRDSEQERDIPETFCGNINDMLDSPFFMDYSIGEVARERITGIIDLYKALIENNEEPPSTIDEQLKYDEYLISLVGDIYIKNALNDMMDAIKKRVGNV